MMRKKSKMLGRAVPGITKEAALAKLLMGGWILYVYDRDSSVARYSLVFGDEYFKDGERVEYAAVMGLLDSGRLRAFPTGEKTGYFSLKQ